jgi:hypothetical protein
LAWIQRAHGGLACRRFGLGISAFDHISDKMCAEPMPADRIRLRTLGLTLSHRIASHRIASHRIASHRIACGCVRQPTAD